METVGEHLKRVRKTCGYSIDDVARVTRINLRYLEAIENDDFSRLPEDIFILGFLRSYARFLGINEQEIISRFKEKGGSETHGVDLQGPEEGTRVKENGLPDFIKNIKIILPVGLGLISLLFVLIIFSGNRENYTVQSSNSIQDTGVEKNMIEPEEKQEIKNEVKNSLKQNEAAKKALEPVLIKIFAKDLTWVQVRIDEKEVKEALMKPGEVVSWNAEGKITMILGNAGGVNVEVNGKAQEPVGKSGEVVRDIVITSAGVSR